MATLTVNLLDTTSVETALRVLGGMTQVPTERIVDTSGHDEHFVQTEPTQRPLASTVDTTQPDSDEPDTTQPDTQGLMWSADYCSTPASLNADGTWRAKRGKKDEYDAAVKQADVTTASDAGQTMTAGMPTPSQPAAPAPTTPVAPISYETMAGRFVQMMQTGAINDYEAVYNALSVNYDDLETNQTSIDRLSAYMDALSSGETHDASVRHAMGAV